MVKMFRFLLLSSLAFLAGPCSAGNADHNALGCWKDTIPRVLGDLEGSSAILDGRYKARADPINKCANVAADKGFTVFAIQDGGQCFGSADGKTKYKSQGLSAGCLSGKGGPMANDVYELSPLKQCLCMKMKKSSLPEGKNCFADVKDRNINGRTALHAAARWNIKDCTKVLIEAGSEIEAISKKNETPLNLAQWKSETIGCESVLALVAAKAKDDTLDARQKARVAKCKPASRK